MHDDVTMREKRSRRGERYARAAASSRATSVNLLRLQPTHCKTQDSARILKKLGAPDKRVPRHPSAMASFRSSLFLCSQSLSSLFLRSCHLVCMHIYSSHPQWFIVINQLPRISLIHHVYCSGQEADQRYLYIYGLFISQPSQPVWIQHSSVVKTNCLIVFYLKWHIITKYIRYGKHQESISLWLCCNVQREQCGAHCVKNRLQNHVFQFALV